MMMLLALAARAQDPLTLDEWLRRFLAADPALRAVEADANLARVEVKRSEDRRTVTFSGTPYAG